MDEVKALIETKWGDKVSFLEDTRDLTVVIDKIELLSFLSFLRDELSFVFLTDLTAIDWLGREKRFDFVYWLSSEKGDRICVKVAISEDEIMPSIASLWKVADWYEREVVDMFGIKFDINKKRILLPDDWKDFPLRKDYPLV